MEKTDLLFSDGEIDILCDMFKDSDSLIVWARDNNLVNNPSVIRRVTELTAEEGSRSGRGHSSLDVSNQYLS